MNQSGVGKYVGRCIILNVRPSHRPNSRLGITVTKRYGPAHLRNRFKRIVREAFRLHHSQFPHPCDILIKPRDAAQTASMQEIADDLIELIGKACSCFNGRF